MDYLEIAQSALDSFVVEEREQDGKEAQIAALIAIAEQLKRIADALTEKPDVRDGFEVLT